MKTILLTSLIAALAALAPLTTLAAADDTATVAVYSNGYRDEATGTPLTTIAPGDTVTWVWESGVHSVTAGAHAVTDAAAPRAFDSEILDTTSEPTTFSRTFDEEGTFVYYCKLHFGMRGVIQVG